VYAEVKNTQHFLPLFFLAIGAYQLFKVVFPITEDVRVDAHGVHILPGVAFAAGVEVGDEVHASLVFSASISPPMLS
jgi:hypothetical protein